MAYKLPVFENGAIKLFTLASLCVIPLSSSVAEITVVGEAEPQANTQTQRQRPFVAAGSDEASSTLRCFQNGEEILAEEGYQYVQVGQNAQQNAVILRTSGDKNQLAALNFGDTFCVVSIQE